MILLVPENEGIRKQHDTLAHSLNTLGEASMVIPPTEIPDSQCGFDVDKTVMDSLTGYQKMFDKFIVQSGHAVQSRRYGEDIENAARHLLTAYARIITPEVRAVIVPGGSRLEVRVAMFCANYFNIPTLHIEECPLIPKGNKGRRAVMTRGTALYAMHPDQFRELATAHRNKDPKATDTRAKAYIQWFRKSKTTKHGIFLTPEADLSSLTSGARPRTVMFGQNLWDASVYWGSTPSLIEAAVLHTRDRDGYFKPHPVSSGIQLDEEFSLAGSPSSPSDLKFLPAGANVHDVVANCEEVVTMSSGTGLEALMLRSDVQVSVYGSPYWSYIAKSRYPDDLYAAVDYLLEQALFPTPQNPAAAVSKINSLIEGE